MTPIASRINTTPDSKPGSCRHDGFQQKAWLDRAQKACARSRREIGLEKVIVTTSRPLRLGALGLFVTNQPPSMRPHPIGERIQRWTQ